MDSCPVEAIGSDGDAASPSAPGETAGAA